MQSTDVRRTLQSISEGHWNCWRTRGEALRSGPVEEEAVAATPALELVDHHTAEDGRGDAVQRGRVVDRLEQAADVVVDVVGVLVHRAQQRDVLPTMFPHPSSRRPRRYATVVAMETA